MDDFDNLVKSLSGEELEACAGELLALLEGRKKTAGAADELAYELADSTARAENTAGAENTPGDEQDGTVIQRAARLIAGFIAGTERNGNGGDAAPAQTDANLKKAAENTADTSAARPAEAERYENAVGLRGLEMGRVSDYFRRDSRRYDTGFQRY
jgi:hypothetical protein